MATFKNTAYRTADSLLTTEMNSVVNDALSSLGVEVDNTTNRDFEGVFDLELATLTPSATAPAIEVFVLEVKDDGTTYPPTVEEGNFAVTIPIPTGAGTKSAIASRSIVLTPGKFKFFIKNKTGVTLNASGNTLKLRRFTTESV
jgi:hypothetical protein